MSLDFIEEMYNSEMIYKKMKYSVHLYKSPFIKLNKPDYEVITRRLLLVQEMTKLTDHLYPKEMILESLQIYFLDLGNIIEKNLSFEIEHEKNNEEIYFEKYLNLLLSSFMNEQSVDYYAAYLNITPQYLNKITKKAVGQTVSKMVESLLFAEARSMLQDPSNSIQEISNALKFSDQSVFGKFFKRNAGKSAHAYRNTKK
nr:helix-turn-helix domain-containing protein [uncultured Flavobacterium sp.]